MTKHKTPLLDYIEDGPWPSFVSDIKDASAKAERTRCEGCIWKYASDPPGSSGGWCYLFEEFQPGCTQLKITNDEDKEG